MDQLLLVLVLLLLLLQNDSECQHNTSNTATTKAKRSNMSLFPEKGQTCETTSKDTRLSTCQ